jgi:hypothetical protein
MGPPPPGGAPIQFVHQLVLPALIVKMFQLHHIK